MDDEKITVKITLDLKYAKSLMDGADPGDTYALGIMVVEEVAELLADSN